jgi:hypothetical protein
MIFGDHVEVPATAAAAAWIAPARRGAAWTVGGLVPNDYGSFVRVRAPAGGIEDWWELYRDLFRIVASVGARHTATADRAWFAVWEGHGFTNSTTHVAWRDLPPDEPTRLAREAKRARLREEDDRRHAATRQALSQVPRFELPHRTYYLVRGPVSAVTRLAEPGAPDTWRHPDLFWPDDRSWFVATDVDFWSLYIGGDVAFATEIIASVPTETATVTLDTPLEVED